MIDIHHPLNVCRASAGTGKTYTLAAYYVGLLLSGEDYRSILAITFTNKATAEMGERILGYLHGIALGQESAFLLRARAFMIRHQDATDEQLAQRAHECFRAMLLDYDNVRIQTIDSFLQTLLSGLAGVLQMSAGLKTELDIDYVISQSVNQLLTTDLSAQDRAILEDYMQLRLDQASQWDVRKSIREMAKKLYNESAQKLDADGRILFDAMAIGARREAMEQAWAGHPDRQALQALLDACHPEDYGRLDAAAYKRLRQSIDDPDHVKAADRFRGKEDSKQPEILQATEIAERLRTAYNTLRLTTRFSREMQLMASLQRIIQRNLAEANAALLAKTSTILSNALKTGDADFILEKAGIRYKHILIDEFQDTSRQQWKVINQLLRDLLASEGHTLLVVGDIKQSIYRWRNGDWQIMADLGKRPDTYSAQLNTAFEPLTRNYRSREQVVNFNLSLFKHIIETHPFEDEKQLIADIYGEGFTPETLARFCQPDRKPGGLVRFRAFTYRHPARNNAPAMIADMFDTMEELLQQGAQPSDFMVLVRYNSEAIVIVEQFAQLDKEQYPLLTATRFVSSDSFLLETSQVVKTVIAALRFIGIGDEVAAQYVTLTTQRPEMVDRIRRTMHPKTPLYEAVSELVRLLCTDEHGQYSGSETAYINCLLDKTRAFVSSYGSSIEDFLVYWEDTLHRKSIPAAATQAIRILTVHTSKGLQAQTLFVPLCNWKMEGTKSPNIKDTIWCPIQGAPEGSEDYVPIDDGADMLNSLYRDDYLREHRNMRIDNLNLLYVALTRAEDNLYISSDFSLTKDGLGACAHVGQHLLAFTDLAGTLASDDLPQNNQGEPYAEFVTGTPVIKAAQATETIETEQAQFWCDSAQVRFVQSQEGALYTDYGDEAYRRMARMETGSLCHEIFAHVRKASELDRVLDDFESQGLIDTPAKRDEIRALISSAWEGSNEMRDWFTAPWHLKLEEPIYMDRRELRPDRVMLNPVTNEAIVLDYKFGVWEDKYITQVQEYMEALRRMGHSPVRGYLWFARKNKLVEVKPEG